MTEPLISEELVALDVDYGSTSAEVIGSLAQLVTDAGRARSAEELRSAACQREEAAGTGVPGRVAIPHCRTSAVNAPTLAFARLGTPVDFHGPDGDAELVFLIAAPEGGGKAHLTILSSLARALVRTDFREALANARTAGDVVEAVNAVVTPPSKNASEQPASTSPQPADETALADTGFTATRIVAVTACPTGIAHTYMAADALSSAAQNFDGVELWVETQGSSQNETLDPALIRSADAAIFATDVGVNERERFAGIPVVESGVKKAINEPQALIKAALSAAQDPTARTVAAASTNPSAEQPSSTSPSSGLKWGKRIQQAVMTGVSYMIPFVAAGGLLIALGFLIGGFEMSQYWQKIVTNFSLTNLPPDQFLDAQGMPSSFDRPVVGVYIGAVLFATGQAAMSFIVAALSGYIAYALAGRPGIAPGFVGGALSVTLGAGFIGGLVTGILAGLCAAWIGTWKVPRVVSSLMPVVIIPLLSSMFIGLIMFLLLGRPLSALMTGLQNWLTGMSGSSAVLLGIILGLMMCFDLGGPVNKAAYLFATAGLSTGDEASLHIMAAVMTAGMVPPIALSLATLLRAQLFTPAELENGKSAWLLGLSFVSEGAIPFAATDPFRVIPSMMAGGAVTGAISMALGVGSRAPHGGIFVPFAIEPLWGFILALVAGIAVSTLCVVATKQWGRPNANRSVPGSSEPRVASTAA